MDFIIPHEIKHNTGAAGIVISAWKEGRFSDPTEVIVMRRKNDHRIRTGSAIYKAGDVPGLKPLNECIFQVDLNVQRHFLEFIPVDLYLTERLHLSAHTVGQFVFEDYRNFRYTFGSPQKQTDL